jgi:hypothetical protein
MMYLTTALSLCGAVLFSTAAALGGGPEVVPGAYIVELADDHVCILARGRRICFLTSIVRLPNPSITVSDPRILQ